MFYYVFFKDALALSPCLRPGSFCLLPKDQGPCRNYIPKYYFDLASGQCKAFIYGGCQGNGNNFLTLKDCEAACKTKSEIDIIG